MCCLISPSPCFWVDVDRLMMAFLSSWNNSSEETLERERKREIELVCNIMTWLLTVNAGSATTAAEGERGVAIGCGSREGFSTTGQWMSVAARSSEAGTVVQSSRSGRSQSNDASSTRNDDDTSLRPTAAATTTTTKDDPLPAAV